MPALEPAVRRINQIIAGKYPNVGPATIHGSPTEIYSYQMRIAYKREDGTWEVVDRKMSPSTTTSRHIAAAREACR